MAGPGEVDASWPVEDATEFQVGRKVWNARDTWLMLSETRED